jgi:SAM-dependent methyltransferase
MNLRRLARDSIFGALDFADTLTGRKTPITPPRRLMNGGTNSKFRSDYHAIGRDLFGLLVEQGGVRPTDRVLDVGCSCGRIAAEFTTYLTSGTYDGFDIERPAVEFCQRVITPRHPNFKFIHADLYNAHYTPDSRVPASEYRFPYSDVAFDFVFLTSVFTHMQRPETLRYLSEISRVLTPGGCVFATFFLFDAQAEAAISRGAADFAFAHKGNGTRVEFAENPDHAVAHPRESILEEFAGLGLDVQTVLTGGWRGSAGQSYQDVIVAKRGSPQSR